MGLQATAVRDIIFSATTYGKAYDELCALTGFKADELTDSAHMVEWQKAACLWDILADMSGTEQIGLYLGQEVPISMTGMVGFLMQSSKTLEEAIEAYCDYGYMVCPMVTFKYQRKGDEAIIELHQNGMWKNTYQRNARIAIDHTLSCTVRFCEALCGRAVYPLRVEVEYAKTAVDEYKRLLNTNMVFNAPLHRMVFRASDVDLPILTRDRSLYAMFKEILAQKKSVFVQNSTSSALKQLLLMQFKGQIATIEEAAEALSMNVRTLQRKLTEEGTSFRTVSAEVRKELSMHLIKRSGNNISEVAEIMGYADPTSFRRAFKTWTQTTPKSVKRQAAVV